jgi:hypothetical protein
MFYPAFNSKFRTINIKKTGIKRQIKEVYGTTTIINAIIMNIIIRNTKKAHSLSRLFI